MVFIRFVNGYVDAMQTSNTAKSIAYLAVEKVGMPIWFVELRHTATHDYLPSLTVLRNATQQALAWINDNYWTPQLESIKLDEALSPEALLVISGDVRQMIETYRNAKERQIEANAVSQPKQDALVISRLVRDLIKRCRSGDDLLGVLIPILLEPGMLVPNSKKMRASSKDLSLDNLGRIVDIGWVPLMNRLHQDLRSTVKDGEPLSFWVSLMSAMLDKLIEANLAVQTAALPTATAEQKAAAKTDSYLITILAWIKYLIKTHYEQHGSFKGRLSSAISSPSSSSSSPSSTPRLSVAAMASQLVAANAAANQSSPMFENDDMINIVEDCLQNILVHFSPLIRSVLNTVIECDAEVKGKIGPILKQIDQRVTSGSSSNVPVAAPTAPVSVPPETTLIDAGVDQDESPFESRHEDIDMAEATTTTTTTTGDNDTHVEEQDNASSHLPDNAQGSPSSAWTLYDEDSWRPCPMGSLPGGIVPDLSLPWDLDRPPIARVMI
ncbi:rRNA-processing protein las1 [Mortierella sp. NVP85]|nr:rRNA-processing protein las1 [Mortierella sp. NVP85]